MRLKVARAAALLTVSAVLAGLTGCAASDAEVGVPAATASPGEIGNAEPAPTPSADLAQPPDCSIFPADNVWHADISTLPVHASSAAWVESIGADRHLHPDFGSGLWEGAPFGIPITLVSSDQPAVAVSFEYADESDPGPYPIPADVRIEGGPDATGDRHVILLDNGACVAYELYAARPRGDGTWRAGSGAVFDLRSNQLRPAGWTSADAAGLPIIAGLVRYEEVAAGYIDHAIRFTAPRTRNDYVWPARHAASRSSDPALPPMGARFRLKASVDTSGFPPQARVIAEALKRYGLILADNGSSWYLTGTQDERWDNDDLRALKSLTGSDFEAVDTSSLMVDPDSGRYRTG
ncbi:MAG: hypothetical protein IRY85_17885 [Micromonosporaceae bacterium]|nr:hypothetical protein [Micromonosporaceae bacterium]